MIKWGNELGKRIDIYEAIIKRNPFSMMNIGLRTFDNYQSSKEGDKSKEE